MFFRKFRKAIAALLVFLIPQAASASPNYHLVGWFNTFVPGGGAYLLGNYGDGALQTSLEVTSFYIGYKNSALSPMTLDGVPEELPSPATSLIYKKGTSQVCTINPKTKKQTCTIVTTNTASLVPSGAVDISDALYADWMQEFAIKYHFVNVYEAYRTAAGEEGKRGPQKIDYTPTPDLFLAPFKWDNLKSLWVWPAILVSAAAIVYSYQSTVSSGQLSAISPLNQSSQRLYDLTYIGMFPVGSAAPEEMFYRGFLQHELYSMVGSPLFSIPLSTTLFAFSHEADDRPSAAASGLYEGIVTHANGGQLSKAIAYHFWADLLAGIYQVAIVRKESGKRPLLSLDLKF